MKELEDAYSEGSNSCNTASSLLVNVKDEV